MDSIKQKKYICHDCGADTENPVGYCKDCQDGRCKLCGSEPIDSYEEICYNCQQKTPKTSKKTRPENNWLIYLAEAATDKPPHALEDATHELLYRLKFIGRFCDEPNIKRHAKGLYIALLEYQNSL